jgi:hypothetical protein
MSDSCSMIVTEKPVEFWLELIRLQTEVVKAMAQVLAHAPDMDGYAEALAESAQALQSLQEAVARIFPEVIRH